jgi:hypothetical protein
MESARGGSQSCTSKELDCIGIGDRDNVNGLSWVISRVGLVVAIGSHE